MDVPELKMNRASASTEAVGCNGPHGLAMSSSCDHVKSNYSSAQVVSECVPMEMLAKALLHDSHNASVVTTSMVQGKVHLQLQQTVALLRLLAQQTGSPSRILEYFFKLRENPPCTIADEAA